VSEAPDYIEPFEAWRVWKVVRYDCEYRLCSVVRRTVWPVGQALAAECLRARGLIARLRRTGAHHAPDVGCECGIYGARLDVAGEYLAEEPASVACVIGRVALWGTVVECQYGFRASRAYPTRIYLPVDAGRRWRVGWDEIALGLARYRVPIETLPCAARDTVGVLAARQAA
jgi:hypothetical protein